MELDQVRDAWTSSADPGSPHTVDAVLARARGLDRIVLRRDRIESGASLVAGLLFAWFGIETPHLLSKIGAAVVVGCTIAIPLRLRAARRPSPDPTAPPREALARELERTNAQATLLETVLWWYLGPLFVGGLLFVGGARPDWLGAGHAVLTGAVLWWLRRLNRDAARELRTRAAELERFIQAIDEA